MKCNSFRFTVTAAIVMAGCLTAAGQTQPTAPKPNESRPPSPATPSPAASEKTPEGSAAAVDPNKYLIGPEDVIFIRVWREPDFTLPAAVRPDGKITMPLIGDVQAGDQTPTQLTKTLTQLLGKYLNNPDVNVIVTDVRSKKYYIDGEVLKPGSYLLVLKRNGYRDVGGRSTLYPNDRKFAQSAPVGEFDPRDYLYSLH